MTISEALRAACAQLSDVTETPRLDAELMMAHALGVERGALLLNHQRDQAPETFIPLLHRRLAREPLAYIIGIRDFWTISLHVSPAVLIPRPDSETLIEAALTHFGHRSPVSILDLGTGSGALLLAAMNEWREARGLGIDASEAALTVARGNAVRLGLAAEFRLGNWAEGIDEPFDLILCNPPYVETGATLSPEVLNEPHGALFAGPEGLEDYRLLAPQIARLIAPKGCAAVEIGLAQAGAVTALFEARGLKCAVHRDLAGRDRCLLLIP